MCIKNRPEWDIIYKPMNSAILVQCSTNCSVQYRHCKSSRCGPFRVNTLRVPNHFLAHKRYSKHHSPIIYNSLVQPHFDYCSSVWGSCSKSLSQKLQNRAARVITFSNYDRSTDELLQMVNWVKLDRQCLVDKSIMMYKIVNRMAPDYFCSHFVFRSDTLTYNLRESDFSLAIPQPRTNYYKKSLSYSGAVLWNWLPLDMRQSPSLNVFKSKLKNYDFDS